MRLETKTRNPKTGGEHWKSKRRRPKKPPAPFPDVHCSRCSNGASLVQGVRVNFVCTLGHPLNPETCGAFSDCSKRVGKGTGWTD